MAKSKKAKSEKITPESISGVKAAVAKDVAKKPAKSKKATKKVEEKEAPKEVLGQFDPGWLTQDGRVSVKFSRDDVTAKRLKFLRDEDERVNYAIPLSTGEKDDGSATQFVGFNGIRFIYPKNVLVEMPKALYLILKNAFGVKDVGKDLRIEGGSDKEEILTRTR